MPQRGLRAGSREVFVPRRGLCAGDLQIIDDSQNSPRQRFRSLSLSSRDRQPSPRADAASNIHRARTWLSSFLGKKPAFIRVRKRARETAGRPAEDTTANVPNWMMRWVRGSVATKWSGHASHASCRAGQADAVRGSEDDRVDAAYADAVRISAALPYLQYRIWSGHASHAAGQVKSVEDDPSRCC